MKVKSEVSEGAGIFKQNFLLSSSSSHAGDQMKLKRVLAGAEGMPPQPAGQHWDTTERTAWATFLNTHN